MDFYKKFLYPRLPPKESFYSSIDDEKRGKGDGHISYRQYLHLKFVWKEFGFKNFRDFHNHYLKKDVLLLVDVFEKFISICWKYYNLDQCHYFSAPGLSWDAMLKMAKVELEKISDPDLHIFIERCMRGGISYVNKRFSKADDKFCPDYDKNKPKVSLITMIRIIYMEMQYVNIYHMEVLNGLKLIMKQLTEYWIKVIIIYTVMFWK